MFVSVFHQHVQPKSIQMYVLHLSTVPKSRHLPHTHIPPAIASQFSSRSTLGLLRVPHLPVSSSFSGLVFGSPVFTDQRIGLVRREGRVVDGIFQLPPGPRDARRVPRSREATTAPWSSTPGGLVAATRSSMWPQGGRWVGETQTRPSGTADCRARQTPLAPPLSVGKYAIHGVSGIGDDR